MVKGINKRVIMIKNPDSGIIEEAIFILKSGAENRSGTSDMVAEANRLIAEYNEQRIIEGLGISEQKHAELEKFLNAPLKKATADRGEYSQQSDWSETERFISEDEYEPSPERVNKSLLLAFPAAIKEKYFRLPPLSFFVGAGVMSAVMLIARAVEFVILKR